MAGKKNDESILALLLGLIGIFVGTATLIVAIVVGFIAFQAWWLMLLLGMLHHQVSEKIPAYGFLPVVIVVAAIGAVKQLLFPTKFKFKTEAK